MKALCSPSRLLLTGALGLAAAGLAWATDPDSTVRAPSCAGGWYPAKPNKLNALLDKLLTEAPPPPVEGKPLALVSPHAGYRFSAPVAAAGYSCLRGHSYTRVFVIAFSHRSSHSYSGVEVPGEFTAYQTPLGMVPIDRRICDDLLTKSIFLSKPGVETGEHSLELQLPFLQKTLSEFRLVPLLVGRMTEQQYAQAAQAILPWIDENTLLVASSDFTHYGSRFNYLPFTEDVPENLRRLAEQAADPITKCDFDGFRKHLAETKDTICGRNPISLLLRILSMQGGAEATRAAFDTSGNLTGDWSSSVTYQSFVFTRRPGTLGQLERRQLLHLARQTVTAHLQGGALPKPDRSMLPAALLADGACFVTLENQGRLRGCIGNMAAREPLFKNVIHNAVNACQDRRFVNNPVTAGELDRLHIEISYLTPMKRIQDPTDIIVGRHGLMITLGYNRGVLLPQVAARYGWTRQEFLQQVCRKAGLPIDAWKNPAAELYSFEAEVFGEPEPTTKH
jgi:hypothetical protein